MPTFAFDSDDLGRTEAFLNQAYAKMRIGGDTRSSRTQILRDAAGTVSVDRLDLNHNMSYDVTPLGRLCLCTVQSGTIRNRVAGDAEDVYGPGDTVVLAPPDRPYEGEVQRSRYVITMLDPGLLADVTGAEEPVRLLDHRPVSADAGRRLARTIEHVRGDLLADPQATELPLMLSAASQLLAATVLSTFPNSALTSDTGGSRDDRPVSVRRAISFMEDNTANPISTADVAAAARVSVRSLQYAFRAHLGTTPMGHLRRVRLAAAHADLRAADPATTTVTGVATRWGFLHAGRFAAAYKAAYGHPPSGTLRD
ncbi:helix-turn-helix domain-containing protein [Actinomadura sp. NEAU-AAG7]|uniref:helix-turn-helix domain-containing protein n=1 Tax=Actinomadura sp. NEAU-AAG7 TaxID=2839640 RepID=UPI001BE4B713|nr:helix-turn-helix domain-containing protein [Actinomadura sp. NEAU-AAG7]MBT2213147.1 helix-turn-helix domain-containing protein [Actinomadura sp. NEAU-AAG7]